MTSDATTFAHPKALGNLAHPRYSRCWPLSFHTGSWCDPIGTSSADPSNVPCGALYDSVVSNQPRSTQSNEYELSYEMMKLTP